MSAPESQPVQAPELPGPGVAPDKKRDKKSKVRTAWISFFGRILAQVLGAVASIVLGILVLQRYQAPERATPVAPPASAPPAARTAALREPGIVALVVLPLANFSGDARQDFFADGMTEALIADLAQIDGLRVISRTSSMQYKGSEKSLPEIAQELGVDLVVEGSVARAGDRVRVTAQLIDAKRDAHLWASSYDHTARDVLTLQGQVASAIAGEVKGALTASQQSRLSQRKPVDPAVYELYLRGRQAWNLRTPAGFQEAIVHFDEAIRKDSGFALAYAGLADTYRLFAQDAPEDSMEKAKAAAEQALKLDDGLAEAHTSLAAVYHRRGNIEAADREFRRALDLNPSYAPAHQWYAILLAEEGHDAEATRHAQQAVTLDPLRGQLHQTLGLVHYYGRRYDKAVLAERRALELAPHLPQAIAILTRSLIEQNKPREAIQICESFGPAASPDVLGALSRAYVRAGDRARGAAILKQLLERRPVPTMVLARFYAATGNPSASFEMLDSALAGGSTLRALKSDPVFDSLRSDSRFTDLVRRAGWQ